jgi:hypothetical protein
LLCGTGLTGFLSGKTKSMPATIFHPSSYRDPSGFLFYKDNILYRQVNKVFEGDFEKFQTGGLYHSLVEKNLIIPFKAINQNFLEHPDWFTTLEPECIPMISYPSEWSFDMLKDAALLTIKLAQEAMEYGMVLKDASAYNVQWHKGKMIFIDSLSFEHYDETKPWIAYRQFCEHFLAPLALMHYSRMPLQQLWNGYSDGIPVEWAAKFLPLKTKFNLHLYLNIHLHASVAGKTQKNNKEKSYSAVKFKNVLRSLEAAINSFSLQSPSGVWSNYYDEARQRNDYMEVKKNIIENWIDSIKLNSAIDIGANEGFFSKLLAERKIFTIAADLDHFSINRLYKNNIAKKQTWLQPMIINLATPTPALGVNNKERTSFLERAKADLVMALALIHHLCIGNNIPFHTIAEMLSNMGNYLVIEFVPKSDPKVRLMLSQKKDIYSNYSEAIFAENFEKFYSILDKKIIANSGRTLFLMQKK